MKMYKFFVYKQKILPILEKLHWTHLFKMGAFINNFFNSLFHSF